MVRSNKEETTMKKTNRIFGAIAVSAALAMGTAMPAFALEGTLADGNAGTQGADKAFEMPDATAGTAGQSTAVNVFYNAEQIQAVVPIEMTIVATGDSDTAGNIMAPDNYRIENLSSTVGLTVSEVYATENGAEWKLGTADNAGLLGANSGTFGNLDVTLSAAGGAPVALKDAKTEANFKNPAWDIAAASTLDIDISGKSLVKPGVLTGGETTKAVDNAFTISYTVAKKTA